MFLIKNLQKEKGITLIALVVTIIVLLILAGVSISMLVGNNSILHQATKAKESSESASELEQVKLAVASALTINNGTLTTDIIKTELINLNQNGILYEGESWVYVGAKNNYNITKNGNVSILKYLVYGNTQENILLPAEYQQVEYVESTGTQYIDTNVIPTVETSMRINIACTETSSDESNWCGSVISDYRGWFAVRIL